MNEWLHRWMQINPLLRYIALLAGAAILLLLGWLLLLRPQRLEYDALLQRLEQQQQSLQQQQHQLALNAPPESLQEQLMQILAQLRPGYTSALEVILATRGSQLMQWQPEAQPRSLTLHLQWPEFQTLFAELAQAAAPFPHRFQLLARPTYLAVELWLEHDDAP